MESFLTRKSYPLIPPLTSIRWLLHSLLELLVSNCADSHIQLVL